MTAIAKPPRTLTDLEQKLILTTTGTVSAITCSSAWP
jgi:hypothetical protein